MKTEALPTTFSALFFLLFFAVIVIDTAVI